LLARFFDAVLCAAFQIRQYTACGCLGASFRQPPIHLGLPCSPRRGQLGLALQTLTARLLQGLPSVGQFAHTGAERRIGFRKLLAQPP